ncbi:hypothetical protein [Klebsiella aerogenes]
MDALRELLGLPSVLGLW